MTALRFSPAVSLAVVGLAISTTGARSALAEARHPAVVVELKGCEQPLEAEVRRIVGVELRATVVEAADPGEAVTRVIATCQDAEVALSLADAASAKRLERSVTLAEAAPSARARLVALAVAELVVASGQEIDNRPQAKEPALPPARPASQPVTRAAQGANVAPVSVMAEAIGVVRAFPGSDLWLWGGGARGLITLARSFTLILEASAEWGKTSRSAGQVAARAFGGALGLGWGVQRRLAFIMPWVGARAGVARLAGEPNPGATGTEGEVQSGPWLGPEAGVAVALFPHAPVHATLALSAGVLLLGIRGQVTGDSNVNILGPWAALVVGVGLARP